MFGRSSKLPVDSIFDIQSSPSGQKLYDEFVAEWKESSQQAIDIGNKNAGKARRFNKTIYDRKLYPNNIDVGDQFLLRNNSERGGSGKLRTHCEDTIYIVTKKADNIPVYDIKSEDCNNVKIKQVQEKSDFHYFNREGQGNDSSNNISEPSSMTDQTESENDAHHEFTSGRFNHLRSKRKVLTYDQLGKNPSLI